MTSKEVWAAPRDVISRLKGGETPPVFDGRWHWKIADPGLDAMLP